MNINWLSMLLNKLPTAGGMVLISLLSLFIVPTYGQNTNSFPDSLVSVENQNNSLIKKEIHPDSLLHFARLHLGTPYKLSGKTTKGFDCSGFVHYVYKKFDVQMPYSCPAISSACSQKVNKNELQKGDLLFFKGSNIKSKAIGHIAIVYAVENGEVQMIHSCRRGVIVETLNTSSYYRPRFLFAKRIL